MSMVIKQTTIEQTAKALPAEFRASGTDVSERRRSGVSAMPGMR